MTSRFLLLAGFAFSMAMHSPGADPKPPRIFLDKPLRIVQYQLKRLNNERLVLVERSTDDKKYAPVYAALLVRSGLSRQYREEAIGGLTTINQTDPITELFKAISGLDAEQPEQAAVGNQLIRIVVSQPKQELLKQRERLLSAIEQDNSVLRVAGFASLVTVGEASDWDPASASADVIVDYLKAVTLAPNATRGAQRERIVSLLDKNQPVAVRKMAIGSLATVSIEQRATFSLLSEIVTERPLSAPAVSALLKISPAQRDPQQSSQLITELVKQAEATAAKDRTRPGFQNAMQLIDQLLRGEPIEKARSIRERLSQIAVRVVQVHTVEEEMRYDIPYFAVHAGRDVQVVLINEDLMPHNFVVTVPGALQEVAELGSAMSADIGASGKQYVPKTDKVLFATTMVQAGKREALTFKAPSEPGEYPYVCTFPRHWMRMYGVMVVVEDLDQWLQNPVKPKDPIGSNRSFVNAWTMDDFKEDLAAAMRGRSPEKGEKIFKEATCAGCHVMHGQGGKVGPDLTDLVKRWKGDRLGILREIIDPSHKIDPKYVVNVVLTLDGKAISGIVVADERDSISILDNPEAKAPTVIPKDDIDIVNPSSQSMMPKALMNQFTKDEIYELMSYLESAANQQ